jgi:hypothetical protein
VLFQNADDLVFGEPAALHLWSFRLGQSLSQTGLGGGGNVNMEDENRRLKRMYADLSMQADLLKEALGKK